MERERRRKLNAADPVTSRKSKINLKKMNMLLLCDVFIYSFIHSSILVCISFYSFDKTLPVGFNLTCTKLASYVAAAALFLVPRRSGSELG